LYGIKTEIYAFDFLQHMTALKIPKPTNLFTPSVNNMCPAK